MSEFDFDIAVVGAGAWGTALAQAARRAGQRVLLWGRDPALIDAIAESGTNPRYLPGIALDPGIAVTNDLSDLALVGGAAILATPAQALRTIATAAAPYLSDLPVVVSAKGLERSTGLRLTQVAREVLGPARPLAILSGPTFAIEVAEGQPTACVIAAEDPGLAASLCARIGSRSFRPYASSDVIGVEIGGAVKNVLAIGCGIAVGRGFGDNARAALITRGLAEVSRLAVALGGRAETVAGLSGLGDLMLTCSGLQSRNYTLGIALGHGQSLDAILAGRRTVAEGVETAPAIASLARGMGVDLPIVDIVTDVLHAGLPVAEAVERLLARPFRTE